MSSESNKTTPPALPKPQQNQVTVKVVRSFSLVVSALILWVLVALVLGLFVVSQPEGAIGDPRTLWEVLQEDRRMVFLLANLFYFFVLVPAGIIFIAMGVIRLSWWVYPMVPVLIVFGLSLLFAFS